MVESGTKASDTYKIVVLGEGKSWYHKNIL
jgi:hypothetical protein